MCISGIYALRDEMSDIENGLSTSSVDIEIVEYGRNNELFQEDGKKVMPGDEISLIPRVNNLGIDCYIRTKITYTVNNQEFPITNYIIGNYSTWTKNGNYYYYDSVLNQEEYVDLFNKVIIPDNLSSEYDGKEVVLHIVVDAIQEKNFDGDWEGIEIQKSIDRSYDIDYDGETSIIYEDDTNNHVTVDDDFFGHLGNMLPGDSMSELVKILNSGNKKNIYYLTIDYDELTPEEIALLQKIKLIIKNSAGEIIVDSNLANKEKLTLGTFAPGNGDSYTIELTLPSDADNEYSKLFAKIMWKFSYENADQQDEDDNNDNNNNHGSNTNPDTGDLKFDLSITVFLLSTLGFIITLVYGKINNKKYKEKRI